VGPLIAGPVSDFGWENVFYMLMVADVIALVVIHFRVDFNPFVANIFFYFLFSCWFVWSSTSFSDSASDGANCATNASGSRNSSCPANSRTVLLLIAQRFRFPRVYFFFLPIFCLWLLRAAARTIDRFPFFVIFLPS
jgi:hypothetical protein